MRVLLVDPAPDGCAGLVRLLEDAGHAVEHAPGAEVLDAPGLGARFELVVIARPFGAPEVLRVRAHDPAVPVLALTEDGAVEARVAALEAGADDALAVPFAGGQMLARTHALGRRGALTPRAPRILEHDGCFIDLDRLRASRGDAPVELAAREAALLAFLHRHRGRGVTREEILAHVFGVSPDVQTRSVDMAVVVLRKKLERDPSTRASSCRSPAWATAGARPDTDLTPRGRAIGHLRGMEQPTRIPNPRIDFAAYLRVAAETDALREARRLTEAQFIALAAQPGTVVLDARSADKYRLLHVAGAVSLPFTATSPPPRWPASSPASTRPYSSTATTTSPATSGPSRPRRRPRRSTSPPS